MRTATRPASKLAQPRVPAVRSVTCDSPSQGDSTANFHPLFASLPLHAETQQGVRQLNLCAEQLSAQGTVLAGRAPPGARSPCRRP